MWGHPVSARESRQVRGVGQTDHPGPCASDTTMREDTRVVTEDWAPHVGMLVPLGRAEEEEVGRHVESGPS
jgi:hypothetical protein